MARRGPTDTVVFDVRIRVGDLEASAPADAVVLPTNTELVFASSLAGGFAAAAAPKLTEEAAQLAPVALGDAVRTDAHVEGIRSAFHVAVHGFRSEDLDGPLREGTTSSDEIVVAAMKRVLAMAEGEQCARLVVPPLCAPVAGYPLDVCAGIMLDVLWDHLANTPGTRLGTIDIVVEDAESAAVFEDARATRTATETRAREFVEKARAEAHRAQRAAEQESARRAEQEARVQAERAAKEAEAREAARRARADAERAQKAREALERDRKQAEKIRKMFVETETVNVDKHAVDALRQEYRERSAGAQPEDKTAEVEEELEGFDDEGGGDEATEVRPPRR